MAQEVSGPRFEIAAEGAFSLRDLGGIRVARDMLTYGVRFTLVRSGGPHPWVDGGGFVRPDFECVTGLACNDEGWILRAGLVLGLGGDPSRTGLHAGLRGGLGAAGSEDITLAYLMGIGLRWQGIPHVAPFTELRWEHITGMNLSMIAAGLSVTF